MLVLPWVNDAAYFDGTGFAEINFSDYQDQRTTAQRFEQEVKLLSHKGILLLLQNEVVSTHSYVYEVSHAYVILLVNHVVIHLFIY